MSNRMRITLSTPVNEAKYMPVFCKNKELTLQLPVGKPKKMINSVIFGANIMNMSPRSILLFMSLLLFWLQASAQYTEKINSNRPGTSQGAFSVGNNVLQLEGGFGLGREKHDIFKTKTNLFNFDYSIRYGLLIEQLEINFNGRFRSDGVRQTVGGQEEKINRTNFEFNTLGAKYLIYDPYKRPWKKQDSLDLLKLKSAKETRKFRWRSLIPAVSAYAGVNFNTNDNPFTFPNDKTISPKFVIATQNNWFNNRAGSWVLVTNLIIDKVTTDNPVIGWIITSTHTIKKKVAIFGEYQGQKSDFYSDDILRLGGAYLFNQDFQLDANVATNFKDTPSIFVVSAGASYRFDWHKKDEIIEEPGLEEFEDENPVDEEEIEADDERELEEIENDSLKQSKQPFVNQFEDEEFRNALEQELDERRAIEKEERIRVADEKQAKKDDKKFRKEERRRLKREAQEAKKAEKAKLKAEKEKQKMIDDIDAELDKMEEDDGVEDELKQIENELKKLEGDDTKPERKKKKEKKKKAPSEEEDVDDAYDQLQKDNEKARKEEEKRRKTAEKRQAKENKKRRKAAEKRAESGENDN